MRERYYMFSIKNEQPIKNAPGSGDAHKEAFCCGGAEQSGWLLCSCFAERVQALCVSLKREMSSASFGTLNLPTPVK